MRARWYDPAVGRFISKDPLSGSAGVPQSLNPYAYAGNNPCNQRDPSGLMPASGGSASQSLMFTTGLGAASAVAGALGNVVDDQPVEKDLAKKAGADGCALRFPAGITMPIAMAFYTFNVGLVEAALGNRLANLFEAVAIVFTQAVKMLDAYGAFYSQIAGPASDAAQQNSASCVYASQRPPDDRNDDPTSGNSPIPWNMFPNPSYCHMMYDMIKALNDQLNTWFDELVRDWGNLRNRGTLADHSTYQGHLRRWERERRNLSDLRDAWWTVCWNTPGSEAIIDAVTTNLSRTRDDVQRTRSGNPIIIDSWWDPLGVPLWVYLLALMLAGDPGLDPAYGY